MDQVRIAVLGCSNFAEKGHVPGIRSHPKGKVAAVFSTDPERASSFAERIGVEDFSDNLRELLSRRDLDAVTIASSNANHYPYAMAALRAGKHVFCEKPLALTAIEAAEMANEAKKCQLVNLVGFTFRYNLAIRKMRKLILDGELGDLHYFSLETNRFRWNTHFDRGVAKWRLSAALHGAGQLGDIGSHCFDLINFLLGSSMGFLAEVSALTHTIPRTVNIGNTATSVDTLDMAACLLRTAKGLQGQMVTSRCSPAISELGGLGSVLIAGQRAAVVANLAISDNDREILRLMQPGGKWEEVPVQNGNTGPSSSVVRMMSAFIDAILRGGISETDADFQAGLRTQFAIDAAVRAAMSKRWEHIAS